MSYKMLLFTYMITLLLLLLLLLLYRFSCVQLFAIPWTAALQASLAITNSWSLLKLMSIEWLLLLLLSRFSHVRLCATP